MGFKTVYQCLTDVFPQIDFRILKAVAIEHSKDADAAVESVLSDVLPYLEAQSIARNPPSVENGHQKKPAEDEEETLALRRRRTSTGKAFENSSQPRSVIDEGSSVKSEDTTHQEEASIPPPNDLCAENLNVDELQCNIEREEPSRKLQNEKCISQPKITEALEVLLDDKVHEMNTDPMEIFGNLNDMPALDSNCVIKLEHEQSSGVALSSSGQEKGASDSFLGGHQSEHEDLLGLLSSDSNVTVRQESSQEESPVDGVGTTMNNSVVEQIRGAEEGLVSELFIQTVIDGCNNLQSKQACTVALLEEMVEAAKNNKTTLFSAMESVMKVMREVEAKEEEAELMKEEAASGCLDIFAQIEELKKMLTHVKEANDLHAGEVYGEKAILATELKELQARLLGLARERDNALAILDEMQQSLNKRLGVAEELRRAAELEKLEKEESARSDLSEQEAVMEKVVQESKILQQEAEENSRLQEFLVDRGQLFDTLQGEIFVICHDVRLLKEKFDKRVPLSKSISSNQTSCILASSGLSSKIVLELGNNSKSTKETTSRFDMVLEPGDKSPSAKEGSSRSDVVSELGDESYSSKEASTPSFNGSFDGDNGSLNDKVEEEERIINCDTQLVDGGWELLGVA